MRLIGMLFWMEKDWVVGWGGYLGVKIIKVGVFFVSDFEKKGMWNWNC